jgi:S-adenosyl-L-methionine hydrolase (adenosine-forming)
MRRITLLTDFGTADGYVAAMKGVIASIAPSVIVDDATHDIPPGDVAAAAWALAAYWRIYPPDTVHVAVVDPGVGSDRTALAMLADERILVGPDNGIFTHVLHEAGTVSAVSITEPAFMRDVVSATFHGRDVFAPAAAHLAARAPLDRLGPPVEAPLRLPLPAPAREHERVRGVVAHVDRFGNLITNIPAAWLEPGARVRIADVDVPTARTYTEVESGALLALEGSRGVVEVSVRDGRADAVLGVGVGAAVTAG